MCLGIELQVLDGALTRAFELDVEHGVRVTRVRAESPAAEVLAAGDVILAIKGSPVTDTDAVQQLVGALLAKTPLTGTVWRR